MAMFSLYIWNFSIRAQLVQNWSCKSLIKIFKNSFDNDKYDGNKKTFQISPGLIKDTLFVFDENYISGVVLIACLNNKQGAKVTIPVVHNR